MQEQALAASERDENKRFGMRSFGTDTTATIQTDLSRTDFWVPGYFIENGARQGAANHSKRPTWLESLESKKAATECTCSKRTNNNVKNDGARAEQPSAGK